MYSLERDRAGRKALFMWVVAPRWLNFGLGAVPELGACDGFEIDRNEKLESNDGMAERDGSDSLTNTIAGGQM
ncbi:hypothetical protein V8F33_008507 [Rhypophila sp. PSN 637]